MIEGINRVFGFLDSAGIRRPSGFDASKAAPVYAGICRGFSIPELKAGALRWVESGELYYPTAAQLKQACEAARKQPPQALDHIDDKPEPEYLPLADQLRPSDYQAYLDAYADGPDGETGEDIWRRMTIWVRDRVQSRGEWKSFR